MTSDLLGLPGYADAVPVASGGTSTVWRARETAFDRLVAVKLISVPVHDPDVRRRFTRELAMAGRLSGHPAVLSVHTSGFTPDGRAYLTSEWCPAGSLADVVARSGPLAQAQVASVGAAVAEALQAAHEQGLVHRDVKPQNVLVTAYGRPALADFGITVAVAEVTSATDSLTPTHAAPEVLEGAASGPAADVWGLGSTLWTLLTGSPPFAAAAGEGVLPVMLRIRSAPLPDVPSSPVVEVLRDLLAKDPAARPTAAQVAERLRPLAAGADPLPMEPLVLPAAAAASTAADAGVFSLLPPSAPTADATVHRPARPAPPAEQPARRDRPALWAVAAAMAVALVAGAGWLLAQGTRAPDVVAVAASPSGSASPTAPVPAPTPAGMPAAASAPGPGAPAGAPAAPAAGTGGAPAPRPEEPAAPAPAPAAPQPARTTAAPATTQAPAPQPAAQPRRIPVYRCDRGTEDLLYSTNPNCKAGYTQIRPAWEVTKDTGVPATTPLWRLRNTSTGVHLLTWDSGERNRLLGGRWEADGQVGWVRTSAASGWTRVWRLHDGRRYAYTKDASLQIWKDRGFQVEGKFWS